MNDYLLIHGDARRLPVDPRSIDAVIADPPYGIDMDTDYTRFSGTAKWSNSNTFTPIKGDDVDFNPSLWIGFPKVVLWGANFYSDQLPGGGWLIWCKKPVSVIGKFLGDCEVAWTKPSRAVYLFHHVWHGLVRETEVGDHFHPTQKPVELMRWCIRKLKLHPNSLILDPYLGSGTTGIAAIQEGHRFIGIDIERKYVEIARRRLERPHQVVGRPGKPEHHPLFEGTE